MTRITTTILVFTILLNGSATIMDVSGLSDDLGVEMETGVSDEVQESIERVQDAFNPNIGSLQSLISLSLAALNVIEIVIEGVLAAPTLLINILGGSTLVETVVTVFFAPVYVISTLEMIAMIGVGETV